MAWSCETKLKVMYMSMLRSQYTLQLFISHLNIVSPLGFEPRTSQSLVQCATNLFIPWNWYKPVLTFVETKRLSSQIDFLFFLNQLKLNGLAQHIEFYA